MSHLFRSFSSFLEVMYDPYLTWRSFLRNKLADYSRLPYKPHAVHVEIVPFIYGLSLCSIYLSCYWYLCVFGFCALQIAFRTNRC